MLFFRVSLLNPHRRFAGVTPLGAGLSALLLALLSCKDDPVRPKDNDTDPPTTVFITGQPTVNLDCELIGFGKYSSEQSTGATYKLTWHVDGVLAGKDKTLNYKYADSDTHEVVLSAHNGAGDVLDADTLMVTPIPPETSECVRPPFIDGRWGVLWPAGSAPVSASYKVRTPAAVSDLVEGYTWSFRIGDQEPVEIASGAETDSVEISFPETGEYSVSLDQTIGGEVLSASLDIQVVSGEPLAEPGKMLLIDASDSTVRYMRFMDMETGLLSEPILSSERGAGDGFSSGICTSDRVIFTAGELNSVNRYMMSVFHVGIDGAGFRRLAELDGTEGEPDYKDGKVVFTGDRRWNYRKDELVIYDYATDESHYLAGEGVDTTFVGWNPVFGNSTNEIYLGANDFPSDRTRLAVFSDNGSGWRRRKFLKLSPMAAYGWSRVMEGAGGVAYDPRREILAFTVSGEGEQNLAVAPLDGSSVKVLADDASGDIFFTPSGSHIIFQKLNEDFPDPNGDPSGEVVMIPRDGGEIISLSRARAGDAHVYQFSGGYCVN